VSTPRKATRQERKDAVRAGREAAERAATMTAARKRRLTILSGILAVAATVIVVVVLGAAGGGGGPAGTPVGGASSGAAVAGTKESHAMLAGIPQSGTVLGDPKAPVTLIEFADLQCPYCREYSLQTLPRVIQDYVRTGKVRLDLRLLTFLGPDSVRGAAVADAAAVQGKLWNVAGLFYVNQGREQSGYATDAFLRRLVAAVPGLDATQVFARPLTTTPSAADAAADAAAARYGVTGTPSFVVGRTGGALRRIDGFDHDSITTAIDAALKA
jgi:protein-disulfide isomerase